MTARCRADDLSEIAISRIPARRNPAEAFKEGESEASFRDEVGVGRERLPAPLTVMFSRPRSRFWSPPAPSGGYQVDVSRRERIDNVSSECFSRPTDARYLSLPDAAERDQWIARRSGWRPAKPDGPALLGGEFIRLGPSSRDNIAGRNQGLAASISCL